MDLKYIFLSVVASAALLKSFESAFLENVITNMTAVGENDDAVIDVTVEGFPPSLDCMVHASDARIETVDIFETNATKNFKITTDFQPAGYFKINIVCFKNDQFEAREESIFFGDKIGSSDAMDSSPLFLCYISYIVQKFF